MRLPINQGVGSTIATHPTEVTLQKAPVHSTEVTLQKAPVRGLRVLVVEDNEDSAEMMADLLRLGGHEVQVARDGVMALDIVLGFMPDIVLCDIGLPGMNGYEVAAHLRKQPELRRTHLVAISGYGRDEDRRRAKDAGFDHHLTKPVEPATLDALLARLAAEQTS